MDITRLKRDGAKVRDSLTVVSNALVTKTGCKICFPKRYLSGKLGSIVSDVQVVGYYGIIVDDAVYAVNKTTALVTLSPDVLSTFKTEDDEYMLLKFDKNSVIMRELALVKNSGLLFQIYDDIVAKGKTPWYLSYSDLGAIFDSALIHSGVNLKAPRSILELMAASRARNPENRAEYYRNMLVKQSDFDEIVPDIIPMRSVAYGATNTTARLLGAYLPEGISSALVNKTDRLEKVEALLLS